MQSIVFIHTHFHTPHSGYKNIEHAILCSGPQLDEICGESGIPDS